PSLVARSPIPCVLLSFVVSPQGSGAGRSAQPPPGPLVTRSPSPGCASRSQRALPSSRVPPMDTCPARRVEIRRAQPKAESFRPASFRYVQRVPSSAIAHVSVSPPLIPDGRISRARLAVSDLHALSPQSLPTSTEA